MLWDTNVSAYLRLSVAINVSPVFSTNIQPFCDFLKLSPPGSRSVLGSLKIGCSVPLITASQAFSAHMITGIVPYDFLYNVY